MNNTTAVAEPDEERGAFEALLNDRVLRQTVTKESHLLFFHIYFPHYIKYPIAEFQRDIFGITENEHNKLACIVAFRGSGKSTIVTFSYSLWATLGEQQKKFVLIICQTQAQARQHMFNLKYELEHNDLLKSDLGPFREDVGAGEWAASSLVFQNTGARIMIASVDQSIRGIRHREYRPDLLILDDIEDMQSARTMEARAKLFDWFTREIVPLGDIGTRVLIVSNLLHEDSLVMRLGRMMSKREIDGIWRFFPLLDKAGNCLWPAKFDTPAKVEALRKSVPSEIAWRQEYLLEIVSDSSRVIHPEWIHRYKDMPELTPQSRYRCSFIGMDLAIADHEKADKTAMVVARVFEWGENAKIYIMPHPVNERLDFPTSLERAKALSTLYAHNNVKAKMFVEDNAYQKALPQMLQKEGYPAVGVPSRGDKRSRLAMISHLIKNGSVIFPETGCEELIMQMTGFGHENHDDLADALSLLIIEVWKSDDGHMPWSLMGKNDKPTPGQDTNGYVSPYIVDSEEDEPRGHYDPELEYRPGRYPLDKKF
jgi:predicted phage terminase large subunit-like protein